MHNYKKKNQKVSVIDVWSGKEPTVCLCKLSQWLITGSVYLKNK